MRLGGVWSANGRGRMMYALTYQRSHSSPLVHKPNRPKRGNMEHSPAVQHVLGRQRVQAKLKIGAPNDKYEHEADRVADQAMRMPDSLVAGASPLRDDAYVSGGRATSASLPVQRVCTECAAEEDPKLQRMLDSNTAAPPRISVLNGPLVAGFEFPNPVQSFQRQELEEEEEVLQTKSLDQSIQRQMVDEEEFVQTKTAGGAISEVDLSVETLIHSLRGRGQILSLGERTYFEPRFGHDFSKVRVHTDARAAESAEAVNARAYTMGQDIVFGVGQYAPETTEGKRLLAHELTHVVQQRSVVGGNVNSVQSMNNVIQRAAPAAAGITIGVAIGKCIIGGIVGALFDGAIQAIIHSIKERTWRFWQASWDYCSLILSAIIGCIAAPISAAVLEPWVTARLGSKLGAMAGTLTGKILLYIAKQLGMGIPKFIVKNLAKLGCISPEQAAELGVTRSTPEEPLPAEPVLPPTPPSVADCKSMSGDVVGNERILMKVNTAEFLTTAEEVKFEKFADSLRASTDKVKIHGLASVDGPARFNDTLSCNRALRAAQLLRERGIPASQIIDVFKHGEVAGPADWQRAVVFERETVGPGPGLTPTPPTPTPTTPMPAITLKSIRFTSDHGVMKDNREGWESSGNRYPEPEWESKNPDDKSAPISHTKGQKIQIAVVLDVSPNSVSGVPFSLRGQGPESFLSFENSGNLHGGEGQVILMSSRGAIPNEINSYLQQVIVWSIHISNQTKLLGISADHDVFVTYDDPSGAVTYKHMATATELTKGFGNNPHDIVSGQMARFPNYNLNFAFENPWRTVDNMDNPDGAADCQTIVRFVQGVNDVIGLPGEARGITVYAKPSAPTDPLHSVLTPKGGLGMHNLPAQPGTGYRPGLFDPGDQYNNYEAALEFKNKGTLLYYPGGVEPPGVGLKTMKEVLYVFKQMAWYDIDSVSRTRVPRVTIYCYQKPC